MIDILRETLEKNKDSYIKYLAELVAIDTRDIGHGIEGGLEKKGQEYLEGLLKTLNPKSLERDFMSEDIIKKSLEEHLEGNEGHNYIDRFNVYAAFEGESSKTVMFNGHMDTMPPGDINNWRIPPHNPQIYDGKMNGLGVCDMKSGLMAGIMAVKLYQDAGLKLPAGVKITSVVDEEGGGNGSIQATMNGQKSDLVVVCEPTDLELIVANMGFIFFEVKVSGVPVHSGAKWLGVSAIEKAIKLINALDELEHGWLMKYKHPLLPPPSLNIGVIEGGTAGSTVAESCTFKTCVHYLPNQMNHKEVVDIFTDTIHRASLGDNYLKDNIPEISIYQAGGAFEMNIQDEVVDKFKKSYKEALCKELNIIGSPAGCDSRLWKNIARCKTLQFGPGRPAQCHVTNEYIEVSDYLDAILVYASLIANI